MDALTLEDYLGRVAVLGRLAYSQRAREAAGVVFSCVKENLRDEDLSAVRTLLPEPVRELWDEAAQAASESRGDCIARVQEAGGYPYRAAAERAVEVIFASLREVLGEAEKKAFRDRLPGRLRELFDRASTCSLDGSAEDFL